MLATISGPTNYKKAISYFSNALKMRTEIGNKLGVSESNIEMGSMYLYRKNYKKALPFLIAGLEIAHEIETKDFISQSYELLSKLYSEQGE